MTWSSEEAVEASPRTAVLKMPASGQIGSGLASLETTVKPLRIALFLDDWRVPRWIESVVQAISACGNLELAVVALNHSAPRPTAYDPRPNPLQLTQFYMYVDQTLFRPQPDALQQVDVKPQCSRCAIIDTRPLFDGPVFRFDESAQASLQRCDIDVVLLFWSGLPHETVLPLARYGLWFFLDHERELTGHAPLGFWEVLDQHRVMVQSLQVRGAWAPAPVTLHRHYGPTHHRSIGLARNNLLWKAPALIVRKLEDLSRCRSIDSIAETREHAADDAHGSGPAERHTGRPESPDTAATTVAATAPSNRVMLKTIGTQVGRLLSSRTAGLRHIEQWVMAYKYGARQDAFPSRPATYKWLLPPTDRFWADPFPVETEHGDFLFFEECFYSRKKGHLSVAAIDQNGLREEPKIILSTDYHLSYPFVFSWDGEQYLIPETQDAGRIDLYKFDSFPYKISHCKTLMNNVRACDATLFESDGRWWMFVAIAPHGSWNVDELCLFHADTPLGPWRPHRNNPVKSDVRSSRPAGKIFDYQGNRYRPAQDCSYRYGYSIRIQKVNELSEASYAEEEVGSLLPDSWPDVIAVHTMNVAGTLSVIDAKMRRHS